MLDAIGLPGAYSFNVFCQYKFWNQNEAVTVSLCTPDLRVLPDSTPLNYVHHFNHSQSFDVEVTEEFLAAIKCDVLAVDIWGHCHGGFMVESTNESLSGWVRRIKFTVDKIVCFVLQKMNTNIPSLSKNAGMM